MLKPMLRNEELSSGVQAKDIIEHLLGDVFLIGEALHAGIVHDDVQAAKVGQGGLE